MGGCLAGASDSTAANDAPAKTQAKSVSLKTNSPRDAPHKVNAPTGSAKLEGPGLKDKLDAKHGGKNKMNKYILKFPKVRKGYSELYQAFAGKQPSSNNKEVLDSTTQLNKLLGVIEGVGIGVDPQDLATGLTVVEGKTISVDDLQNNDEAISFRDFVVGFAHLFPRGNVKKTEAKFTKLESESSGKADRVIEAFKIMAEMFSTIDEDDSTEITFDELKAAFGGLDLSGGSGASSIYETRMKELDFNNDKQISFPEFSIGITAWVNFTD